MNNLYGTIAAVLKGKLTTLNIYSKKREGSPISNLTLHLQELDKINFEKIKNLTNF